MNTSNYVYTPAGKQVMKQMVTTLGTRVSIDAITDYNADFNNDGKVSGLELTILRQSINRKGKVDKRILQQKLNDLRNGTAIYTVTTSDEELNRNVSYVKYSNYKYIEVEEDDGKSHQKRVGIHPDRIEIEDYNTGQTIKIPRTKETEEQYLAGIDLDI